MKKGYILTLFLTLLLISCSNETENTKADNSDGSEESEEVDNLIDVNNLTYDYWITSEGSEREDEDMVYTSNIDYTPEESLLISHDVYVSYYEDDVFLETILHNGDKPLGVQKVENANNIIISFRKQFIDNIVLENEE